jgi:hypothetical protein
VPRRLGRWPAGVRSARGRRWRRWPRGPGGRRAARLRRDRRPRPGVDDDDLVGAVGVGEDRVEQAEVRLDAAAIRLIVDPLNPQQAAVLKLGFDCHLTTSEVGARLLLLGRQRPRARRGDRPRRCAPASVRPLGARPRPASDPAPSSVIGQHPIERAIAHTRRRARPALLGASVVGSESLRRMPDGPLSASAGRWTRHLARGGSRWPCICVLP